MNPYAILFAKNPMLTTRQMLGIASSESYITYLVEENVFTVENMSQRPVCVFVGNLSAMRGQFDTLHRNFQTATGTSQSVQQKTQQDKSGFPYSFVTFPTETYAALTLKRFHNLIIDESMRPIRFEPAEASLLGTVVFQPTACIKYEDNTAEVERLAGLCGTVKRVRPVAVPFSDITVYEVVMASIEEAKAVIASHASNERWKVGFKNPTGINRALPDFSDEDKVSIYVANIDSGKSKKEIGDELVKLFGKYGNIRAYSILKRYKKIPNSVKMDFICYAFIVLSSLSECRLAIKHNRNATLFGRKLQVEHKVYHTCGNPKVDLNSVLAEVKRAYVQFKPDRESDRTTEHDLQWPKDTLNAAELREASETMVAETRSDSVFVLQKKENAPPSFSAQPIPNIRTPMSKIGHGPRYAQGLPLPPHQQQPFVSSSILRPGQSLARLENAEQPQTPPQGAKPGPNDNFGSWPPTYRPLVLTDCNSPNLPPGTAMVDSENQLYKIDAAEGPGQDMWNEPRLAPPFVDGIHPIGMPIPVFSSMPQQMQLVPGPIVYNADGSVQQYPPYYVSGTHFPAPQFSQPQNLYYPAFYPPPMPPIPEGVPSARPINCHGVFAQGPNQGASLFSQPVPEINMQHAPKQAFDANTNGSTSLPVSSYQDMGAQPTSSSLNASEQVLPARVGDQTHADGRLDELDRFAGLSLGEKVGDTAEEECDKGVGGEGGGQSLT